MTAPATAAPLAPLGDDEGRLRLMSRLTVAYVLDAVAIARGDGHVLDTLLVSAIIQANVQEISRRPDLHRAYAESDEIPPDDLRVPISINALSSSLQIPFETARRRVKGLVAEGMCRTVGGGVIVPAEVLQRPHYYADAFRGFQRLQTFYYQLADLGLLRDLPASAAEPGAVFPIRAAARLVGAYMLRVVEDLAKIGDLLDALILLEIFRSNVADWPADLAHSAPIPDDRRLPMAAQSLAVRLGVPYETARRRVTALMEAGFCERVKGGLIVPARTLAGPRLRPALIDNASNLHRLFAALSQLGVLKVWDEARPLAG
ncbi:hypothetical protein [Phenylobacterium soli]|nr:hypothetical protein [Phenylobacterium soli]